jgi:amino acid transporter
VETHQLMLRANVIGLLAAATLGTVMLSPAMTLYGTFGPAFTAAGKAAPLAYAWALLATVPTALSYALVSREHPSSGSAYAWMARATTPGAGAWTGWMVFLYYLMNFVIQPLTLGLFFNDLLTALGFHPGYLTYTAGVLVGSVVPASIVYRGIAPSSHGALMFLLFEVSVVVALCLTIVWLKPLPGVVLSGEGFHVGASSAGIPGIFQALIFGMLGFCGFDVISTLAEETKMARKLIPQATLLSLFVYGVAIIAGIWCLTYSDTPDRLKALSDSTGGMPITAIASTFWGKGSIFIIFTGFSAALGIAIATSVGASRVLFAMGRDGFASPSFATVHERHSVPWSALHVIYLCGVVGPLALGALIGPYKSFVWFCMTTTFFAMVTYLLVNVSSLLLFRDRALKSASGFALYAVVPILGIAFDGYILVRSFFIELWGQSWAEGRSVLVFDVACAILALFFLRQRLPAVAPSPART